MFRRRCRALPTFLLFLKPALSSLPSHWSSLFSALNQNRRREYHNDCKRGLTPADFEEAMGDVYRELLKRVKQTLVEVGTCSTALVGGKKKCSLPVFLPLFSPSVSLSCLSSLFWLTFASLSVSLNLTLTARPLHVTVACRFVSPSPALTCFVFVAKTCTDGTERHSGKGSV